MTTGGKIALGVIGGLLLLVLIVGGWVSGAYNNLNNLQKATDAQWAEYLYYQIHGSKTLGAPYLAPAFGVASPTFSWSNYNVQVFRIAASYKF